MSIDFNAGNRPIESFQAAIGNEGLIRALKSLLRHRAGGGRKPRAFVAGPSGSGKSTLIDHFARALGCQSPVGGTEPCGLCLVCKGFDGAMFTMAQVQLGGFFYCPINCRHFAREAIEECLREIRWSDVVKLIHLEEASGLKSYERDEFVMKFIDEPNHADAFFIASAADATRLDPQFLRRFTPVKTSPASTQEFALYLARRCHSIGIGVPDIRALYRLAERCWHIVGLAEPLLDRLRLEGEPLTRAVVLDHPFPENDPWVGPFFPV